MSASSGRYRGIAPVAPWGTVKTTSKLPYDRLEKAEELATFKGTVAFGYFHPIVAMLVAIVRMSVARSGSMIRSSMLRPRSDRSSW